jgi:hypothetical protein
MGILTKAILEAVEKTGKSAKEELIPASKALEPHEGKTLKAIQYDRMRVNPETGDFGGPEYSNLSEISDPHRKARAVAAVSTQGAGTKYINQFINEKPGSVIHVPLLGSVEQHRGNPTMFGRFHQELMDKINKGEVSPEQINAINDKLNTTKVKKKVKDGYVMKPLFAEPVDVTSMEFIIKPKTFDQRTKFADVINGEGIGGKKGQAIDIVSRLADVIDPYTAEAPAGSFGHRLMELEPNIIYDPTLHGDYPFSFVGKDLGVRMTPIPSNLMTDFNEFVRKKTISEKFPEGREPTAIDFRTGDINQEVTANWLQYLKDNGYKKGGDVHMAGGGKILKALMEGAKKSSKKTAYELAHEEAQRNAVDMLGLPPNNTAKDRARAMGFDVDNPVYHGTTSDIKEINPSKYGSSTETSSGDAGFWSSDDSHTAESFADYAAYAKPTNKNPRLMHLSGEQVRAKHPNRRQNIIPMYINKKDMLSIDQGGTSWEDLMKNPKHEESFIDLLNKINNDSYSVGEIKNFNDVADFKLPKTSTHYVSPHPSSYRSINAAFDPAEANSGDLLKAKGGIVKSMADEFAEIVSDVKKPEVNRIDMNYKDVTKRVPELTEAANRLAKGEISAEDYDYLVNLYKPVKPYDFVPQPATTEDAMRALTKNKQPMFGKIDDIQPGEQTDLRLDIPAYRDHGVWVNSIHRKDAPTIYGSVSSVKNATMIGSPDKALKVAKGETSKAPFAVIRGEWNPTDEQAAVENAQKYLNDKDWVQVGYDPERHGYFYNRNTMEPIHSAEEVIQIGPLVLAKNPKYAEKAKEKFKQGGSINLEDELKLADISHAPKFARGGAVEDDTDYIQEDPTAYLMNKIKPVETKITSAEQFRKIAGKPIPYVNEAVQALIRDAEKVKPRAIIDVPVNTALEIAGIPGDLMKDANIVSPYRQDVVMPKDQAKGIKIPSPLPTSEEAKGFVKDIGITEDDYPALQVAAGFMGAPEIKAIGKLSKAVLESGAKTVGKTIAEGIERDAIPFFRAKDYQFNIIKDPGGMLVGGEKALDDELRYMKKT